jgi:SAM-dependent methyltransferase
LDIVCGSGYLLQHIPGFVVGLGQSASMVGIAQSRLPLGLALIGDALALPFADKTFDGILTGHFYGHLPAPERSRFLAESRRVGANCW